MRRGALLVLLVALAGAVPAQAVAAPVPIFRFVPSYGEPYASPSNTRSAYSTPALASVPSGGPDLVWARASPGGGWVVERGPSGGNSRLGWVPRPSEGRSMVHTVRIVGASPGRAAWTDSAFDVLDAHGMSYRTARSRITTVTPAAAPELVVGCSDRDTCACPPHCSNHTYPAELDGDVLAYVDGAYPNRSVVIDDLSSSEPPARIETHDIGDFVQLAGDHVAFTQFGVGYEPRTVVYDWRARREVYAVALQSVRDLQPDGKLLATNFQDQMVWYSPAEPHPHVIAPPPGRHLGDARMARDRIAFTHARRYGDGPVLAITDLTGDMKDIGPGPRFGDLAFDGMSAGWMAERCGLIEVFVLARVDQPGGDARSPKPCSPPAIRDLGFGSGGRIVVKAVCPTGCHGILGIYAHAGFRVPKLVTRRMNLRRGSRVQTIHLVPPGPTRRALERHTGPVRLQARYLGRDGRGQLVGASKAGTVKRP